MTRAQVIRRMQLTIKQFRELCILKGLHPVEPGRKRIRKQSSKTWYFLKDVTWLKSDPGVEYFRKKYTYDKKEAKYAAKGWKDKLINLRNNKPELDIGAYVKDRYPSLQDAINDMDDALCVVSLLQELQANKRAEKRIKKSVLRDCERLVREWNLYVAESHSLTKVFVSIKGTYYQANVRGAKVMWLVPHGTRPMVPRDVDMETMGYFAEFYISMLSFIFYRLYTEMGFVYPPRINRENEQQDLGMRALELVPHNTADVKMVKPVVVKQQVTAEEKKRLSEVERKLNTFGKTEQPDEEEQEVKTEPKDEEIPEEFRKVDEQEGENLERYQTAPSLLFANLKFWINREVQNKELQFMIRAFGAVEVFEGICDENDTTITHQIVDRDWPKENMKEGREYIQPQWVFDSINAGILLPYHEYSTTAILPPHLSPFVDDKAKKYTPKQREHLDKLIEQSKSGKKWDDKEEVEDEEEEGAQYIGENDEDEDVDGVEARYERELAAEKEGRSYEDFAKDLDQERNPIKTDDDSSDDDVKKATRVRTKKEIEAANSRRDERERTRMAMDLMSAKNRRIVRSMREQEDKKAKYTYNLQKKARKAEKGQRRALAAAQVATMARNLNNGTNIDYDGNYFDELVTKEVKKNMKFGVQPKPPKLQSLKEIKEEQKKAIKNKRKREKNVVKMEARRKELMSQEGEGRSKKRARLE